MPADVLSKPAPDRSRRLDAGRFTLTDFSIEHVACRGEEDIQQKADGLYVVSHSSSTGI
jgi:hypothetical protein